MAEEKEKSRREAFTQRLQEKYPNAQFDDEDVLFGQISDDYDSHENELAGYKDREQKFSDMFTSDPRSARMMLAWRDGDDPAVALVRMYGQDIKDAIDDPERQEAIAQANKEYMETVAKEKEYEEEYAANLAVSLQEIEQLQAELGLSDDEIDSAMEKVITTAKDAMLGKFSRETLEAAIKALNYDTDVETARAEGEVQGKNTRIREQLRKPQRGDGTPQLDGKNGAGAGRGQDMPDLGAIDRYADGNMSIFERGGERRTPIKR